MTVCETYFRDKKRVGLKSWEKGEERPRFEKIACGPSLGAGTGRQRQSTKILEVNLFRKRSLYHKETETLRSYSFSVLSVSPLYNI